MKIEARKERKKFMNIKKLILPTLTVLMLTSQLTGCSTANSAEAMNMLKANETIEIAIPEPENIEQGTELQFEWTELAYLDSYESLRNTMDDSLYIIKMADNGKNGVIYVTEDGNHSNNATLQDAFNNKKFINNYWNNKETNQRIIQSAKQTFSDLEEATDKEAILAAYSAYYNLLPSYDANYANMQSTLSRLEAMSLLYRATNPVDDTLQVSADFTSKVGDNEHSIFAEQIDNQGLTYLTSTNNSLDESTATGTMTRAEYIYMLVNAFYNDEYNTLTKDDIKSFSKSTEFVDLKNAGNVAKEQKYIYTEKNKETGVKEEKAYNRYQSYELNYCLQNVEDGLTENLFKAYIIANNHNILTDTEETNWELGLTKEYALELLTNVLEEVGGKVNYDRGESKGEIIINKVETEKTEVTESNGQLTNTEIPEQHEEGSYYVELAEDGSRKYSIQLITDCMGSEAFEGLTEEEIITVLNNCIPDNIIGDTYEDEAIRDKVGSLDKEWVYQLADKELPSTSTTTPSTPSTTTNNNSSTTNTTGNTTGNTSGGSSITSDVQPSTPSVQPSTPSTEPTVGNTGLTQSQIDAIRAENKAPGGKGSHWDDETPGHHSGESWNGVNGRD